MAVLGVIAATAREQLPITWDALANDPRYGEPGLQRAVELVKFKTFGMSVEPDLEEDTYNPLIVEYVGKLVALQIIPAGADFWSSQTRTLTAKSGNETKAFNDRVADLWRLYDRLRAEVTALYADAAKSTVGTDLPGLRLRKGARIKVADPGGALDGFVTGNPQAFARQHALTTEEAEQLGLTE